MGTLLRSLPLFGQFSGIIYTISTAFWMWMIYDCIQNEPDRNTWIWILIMLNVPGAVIYFIARRLPHMNIPLPPFLKRWTHGREIDRCESAIRHIGGTHQFIEAGDVYLDVGLIDKAAACYENALKQSPNNLQALWGFAKVNVENKQDDRAKEILEKLLSIDPKYQYGEPSLAYAQILFDRNDFSSAKNHLLEHLKKWTHPQARVMMAKILIQEGDTNEARQLLENVIMDIKGTPGFYRRQNMRWARQAKAILHKTALK